MNQELIFASWEDRVPNGLFDRLLKEVKSGPRQFQFTLRMVFVLVTLACVVLAWVGHSLRWIKERQAVRDEYPATRLVLYFDLGPDFAPGGLWLFGEKPAHIIEKTKGAGRSVAEIERLFPEAQVVEVP